MVEKMVFDVINKIGHNEKLLAVKRRRRLMWITPCKRSAARGKRNATLLQRAVGAQLPTTRLNSYGVPELSGTSFHPELRRQRRLARGYSHSTPSELITKNTKLSLLLGNMAHKIFIL